MAKTYSLESGKSGKEFYAAQYRQTLEKQAEWLRRGAAQKADSVEQLLRRHGIEPEVILELGCGTGAVIRTLQERGLARSYFGVDYSEEAVGYLESTSTGIRCAAADITQCPNPFERDAYDVVVLSHTVEHLEEPPRFLEAMRRIPFEYLVVEVPLEDLFFGRVKALVKDRRRNPAGHVQFFSRGSFRALLTEAAYTILDERCYAPWFDNDTLQFAYGGRSALRRAVKGLTEHYLPRYTSPLWTRMYHAHYALLCRKAPPT